VGGLIMLGLPAILLSQSLTSFDFKPQTELKSLYVYAITQDEEGYLWVCTEEGLQQFNGRTFRSIPADSAGANNFPTCILSSRDKQLFTGHFDGSISWLNQQHLEQLIPAGKGGKILQLLTDENDTLYALSQQSGLMRIDQNQRRTVILGSPTDDMRYKQALALDDGRFLFAGNNGVVVAQLKSDQWQQVTPVALLAGKEVVSLHPGRGNTIMVVTAEHGVFSINTSSLSAKRLLNHLSSLPVRVSGISHDSLLWVAATKGLELWSSTTVERVVPGMPAMMEKASMHCFYQDREGTMWIGTYGQGLFKASTLAFDFIDLTEQLGQVSVRSVEQFSDAALLAGTDKGLIRITNLYKHRPTVHVLRNVTSNAVSAIACGKPGEAFVAIEGEGVFRMNENQPLRLLYPTDDRVNHLMVDSENAIWVSTTINGAIRLNQEGKAYQLGTEEGLPHNQVLMSFQDNEQRVWFATHGGGISVAKNEEVVMYDQKGGLSAFNFNTIAQKANSNIWFGTDGSGLHVFDGNQFSAYGRNNKLPSAYINNLVVDKNQNIWASHRHGISRIEYEEGNIKNIDFGGALVHKNTACLTENNIIWLGADDGLVRVFPSSIVENHVAPGCVLRKVTVNNQEIALQNALPEWQYGKFEVVFLLDGLSFVAPEEVRFRYQLEGYEEEWSEPVANGKAVYRNLREGDYTFVYQCANNDGVWGSVQTFRFVVHPPFWRSTWFLVALGIAVLLLFFMVLKWRERALEEDKRQLEIKVQERTVRIAAQKDLLAVQNKEIRESIQYARRIQEALLDEKGPIEKYVEDYFILHMPKDIVSGDFYWIRQAQDRLIVTAVDCTGHGVPGAFMSIIGAAGLKDAVDNKQLNEAGTLLDALNESVTSRIHNTSNGSTIRDGMDMALCSIGAKDVQFAGAKNPLYRVRHGVLEVVKSDRFAIGSSEAATNQYKTVSFKRQAGECLYLFSDGYADQFGGPANKKYQARRFREKLEEIHHLPMNAQREELRKSFMEWKGDVEQIDDVLIIGIKL
jgi:ligand-binding sensor domain-containing protein/serine phosphatase RsbU (regulator of sigma subunit)